MERARIILVENSKSYAETTADRALYEAKRKGRNRIETI